MPQAGKPVDHALRARREADIRASALDVLTSKGYAGMRLDEVARLAGVSKSAVYLYFDSKADLYKSVLKSLSVRTAGEIQALRSARDLDYPQRLARTLDSLYAAMLESPMGALLPVVSETARQYPDLAAYFLTEVRGPLDLALLGLMAEGVAAGAFADRPITRSVPLLVGPIVALALQQSIAANVAEPPVLDLPALKRAHYELLMAALAPSALPDAPS